MQPKTAQTEGSAMGGIAKFTTAREGYYGGAGKATSFLSLSLKPRHDFNQIKVWKNSILLTKTSQPRHLTKGPK